MADPSLHSQYCRIQYTDLDAKPLSDELAAGLKEAGVETTPASMIPVEATFGTPEVILTIVATAAAKAVFIATLRAVERHLKQSKETCGNRRIQIVIDNPGRSKKRFPFSLQGATGDAIEEFVSSVIDSVAEL